MRQLVLPALAALALAGCAATTEPPSTPPAAAAADNKAALSGLRELKMAFDFTDGNPEVLVRKLDVVEATRKQLVAAGVTPKMVLAFRGGASYYTQLDLSKVKEADRAEALKVRARLRGFAKASGVEALEQCNMPLEQLKLKSADLMPEVKLVGNGWISLVAYQGKGYGYIAP